MVSTLFALFIGIPMGVYTGIRRNSWISKLFMSLSLVGVPNCGKTALFNRLTGSRQKVANYPGVTVERKEGRFSGPRSGRTFRADPCRRFR